MSTEIQVFNFENSTIRVFGTFEEPLFVAADVCKALRIQNVTQALQVLDDFDRSMLNIYLGKPAVCMLKESGLYTLILRCRNAVKEGTPAYRFRVWVTREVIPSIRKTRSYSMPKVSSPMFQPSGEPAKKVEAYFTLAQLMVDKEHVTLPVAKAYALDAIHEDTGLLTSGFRKLLPAIAPKNQAYLNATQIGLKVNLSAVSVNKRLAELNLIKKVGKNWVLTEEGTKYGEAKPYSRHSHSGYDVKWRESVLTLFPSSN